MAETIHRYTKEDIQKLNDFLKTGEKTSKQIQRHFNMNWHKVIDFINCATDKILIYEESRNCTIYYNVY